jgi:transcriptional regulator with XRE-family HTH domain
MARSSKEVDTFNKFIGNKIFSLRLGKGISRHELSKSIGVTHQQLQKYEKGENRISAARLILIAKALNVIPAYFYEELEVANCQEELITQHQRMCLEVSRNFMKIANPEYQTAVNTFIKTISKAS